MAIMATRPPRVGKWTEQALRVLRERYLTREGDRLRRPRRRCAGGCAVAIAQGEDRWGKSPAVVHEIAGAFYDLMVDGKFLPNSPTLMNAGRDQLQYSACFVLPVEDSMEDIFDAVKAAAIIHKSGGGTGFAFSRLRPRTTSSASTGGTASGPVSFMQVFNGATEAVKQGGTRRGANMGILRDRPPRHPRVHRVQARRRHHQLQHLGGGDRRASWTPSSGARSTTLIDPAHGEVVSRLAAREVFDRIVRAAWQTGDPGMVFIDRINASPANPTPEIGLDRGHQPLRRAAAPAVRGVQPGLDQPRASSRGGSRTASMGRRLGRARARRPARRSASSTTSSR